MRWFGRNWFGPAPVDNRQWLQRSLKVALGMLCVGFAAGRIAWADTTIVIGFDDRPAAVPKSGIYPAPLSSYQGLEWHHLFSVVTAAYGGDGGVVSPTNAVLVSNHVGIPARIDDVEGLFDLNSAWLTALGTNAEVQVQGYAGTTLLYDNTYTVRAGTPTLIQFDYLGIDGMTFLATYPDPGGPSVPGGYITTWEFLMDDVTVTFIPEPGVAGLWLLGAAVWSLRRRRSERMPSRTVAGLLAICRSCRLQVAS